MPSLMEHIAQQAAETGTQQADPVTIDDKLQELLRFAKEHGLAELEWKDGIRKIAFRLDPDQAQNNTAAETNSDTPEDLVEEETLVTSPMVGIFRRAQKDKPPFVMIGNHIKPGDRVAIVECMKIPTDVTSFYTGEITKILVEDGQPVEYGQPLFSVKPAEISENV